MNKKEKIKERILTIIVVAGIIGLWISSWIYIDRNIPWNYKGIFGDKFGAINSLFSGLALGGIILSIRLQQKELSLQRKELADTRQEFKDQNFQTTFFNLLKTQRQLADEITTSVRNLLTYDKEETFPLSGRAFFHQSKTELKRISSGLKSKSFMKYSKWDESMEHFMSPTDEFEEEELTDSRRLAFTFHFYKITEDKWNEYRNCSDIELARLVYGVFFDRFHFVIGHYFRHLYHIFLFLEEQEYINKQGKTEVEVIKIENNFKSYANFVQAQMTTPELFLAFYNSLSFLKFQKLLIKYEILENLTSEDLLEKSHNCIDGIKLKSRSELTKIK